METKTNLPLAEYIIRVDTSSLVSSDSLPGSTGLWTNVWQTKATSKCTRINLDVGYRNNEDMTI